MLKNFINRKKQQKQQSNKKSSNQQHNKQHIVKQTEQKVQISSSEETQQIIDSLINIHDQIKITKNTKELKASHPTLCYINKMLCQESIDVQAIKNFLRNKGNQMYNNQKQSINGKNNINYNVKSYNMYSDGLIFQFYSIRALLWKIALRYLPISKNKWISYMEGKMIEYHEQIRQHILDIIVKKKKKDAPNNQSAQKVTLQIQQKKQASDHPLNLGKQSKWKTFFDDRDLWNIIQKDTIRTKPTCLFFQLQYQIQFLQYAILNKYKIKKSQIHLSKQPNKEKTFYYDCLTRIIYIYLKRNPQMNYCQGMNELAALIFYSLANKNSVYFRRVAQSDSYFCFQKIMNQLIKQNLHNIFLSGQRYSLKFEELLKKIDLRLYEKLSSNIQYFNNLKIISIKWFNSLFLSQYQIDDNLILWDAFISVIHKNQSNIDNNITISNLVISLALAIVHLSRKQLDNGQNPLNLFAKITFSPTILIEKALNLYKIFHQFFL